MDHLSRLLAMRVAKASTRRDFLSMAVKGAVGIGFGAGFLFGGKESLAATTPAHCTVLSYSNTYGCTAYGCTNGDSNGCWFGTPTNYCNDCANNGCNSSGNNQSYGHWTCCCNGKAMKCVNCGANGSNGPACVCSVDTGEICKPPANNTNNAPPPNNTNSDDPGGFGTMMRWF